MQRCKRASEMTEFGLVVVILFLPVDVGPVSCYRNINRVRK